MIQTIETMLDNFERGKLSRRQLVLSLAALTAAAQTPPKENAFEAVTINHVTMKVPDLHRTSKFLSGIFRGAAQATFRENPYLGVGDCFFGIEQGDGEAARVDHYDFGIAGFNADDVRAKLRSLNLKFDSANSKESFKFYDPDGFHVQVNAPDYVGHVG